MLVLFTMRQKTRSLYFKPCFFLHVLLCKHTLFVKNINKTKNVKSIQHLLIGTCVIQMHIKILLESKEPTGNSFYNVGRT